LFAVLFAYPTIVIFATVAYFYEPVNKSQSEPKKITLLQPLQYWVGASLAMFFLVAVLLALVLPRLKTRFPRVSCAIRLSPASHRPKVYPKIQKVFIAGCVVLALGYRFVPLCLL
jgi:MFS family permease